MPARREERNQLRRSLAFDGFRSWNGFTFLRPLWPKAWAEERARWYLERVPGLAITGPVLSGIPASRLYDLEALDREARKLARRLGKNRALARSPARAFKERLEMGGLVARLAGHDPRLPSSLWGKRTGMRELARELAGFEKRVAPRAQRFLDMVLGKGPLERVRRNSAPRTPYSRGQ